MAGNIRQAGRKLFPVEERIQVVPAGLCGEDSVAELCRPAPGSSAERDELAATRSL